MVIRERPHFAGRTPSLVIDKWRAINWTEHTGSLVIVIDEHKGREWLLGPLGVARLNPDGVQWKGTRPGPLASWRQKVFAQQGRKCCRCGSTERLHVHHKKEWAEHPDLRFNPENGEVLCHRCHNAEHVARSRARKAEKRGGSPKATAPL